MNTGCDGTDLYEFAKNGVIGPDEKTFTSFSLAGRKGSINNSTLTINVSLPVGTNVYSLIPYFASRGDHVEVVAGTPLISGTQAFDFSATVTFTVYAKNGSFQNYEVIVTIVTVPVTGVVLDTGSIMMDHYGSENLIATVYPANATTPGVTWASSDPGVVAVSGGTINGVYPGSATITVTTDDGGFTDTCTVLVVKVLDHIYPTPPGDLYPYEISLSPGTSTNVTIAGYFSDSTIEPIPTLNTFIVDNSGGTDLSYTYDGTTLTVFAGAYNGDGSIDITHIRVSGSFTCTLYIQVL